MSDTDTSTYGNLRPPWLCSVCGHHVGYHDAGRCLVDGCDCGPPEHGEGVSVSGWVMGAVLGLGAMGAVHLLKRGIHRLGDLAARSLAPLTPVRPLTHGRGRTDDVEAGEGE